MSSSSHTRNFHWLSVLHAGTSQEGSFVPTGQDWPPTSAVLEVSPESSEILSGMGDLFLRGFGAQEWS